MINKNQLMVSWLIDLYDMITYRDNWFTNAWLEKVVNSK